MNVLKYLNKIVTTFYILVQPNFERFTFYDTLISSSLEPNQTFHFHKHLHNFICYCSSQKKSEGTDIVIDRDRIRHEVFPCPSLHSPHVVASIQSIQKHSNNLTTLFVIQIFCIPASHFSSPHSFIHLRYSHNF